MGSIPGRVLRLDAPTCPACGTRVQPRDVHCSSCGTELVPGHPSVARRLVPVAGLLSGLAVINLLVAPLGESVPLLAVFFGAAAVALWILLFDDVSYAEAARWLTAGVVTYGLVLATDFVPADILADPFVFDALLALEVAALGVVAASGLAFLRTERPAREVPEERRLLYALVLAPALWLVLEVANSLDPWNILMMTLSGAAAFGAWSVGGLFVARHTLLRSVRKPGLPLVRLRGERPDVPRPDPRTVLAYGLVPLLFAYAVAAWSLPFTAAEAIQQADAAIDTAWIVFAAGSVLIVPGKWLIDLLAVRTVDPDTGVAEPADLPVIVDDFVGVSALLSVIAIAVSSGAAFGLEPLGAAVLVMGRTLFFLLPPALTATYLYVRDMLPLDLELIQEEIDVREADSLGEVLAGDGAP